MKLEIMGNNAITYKKLWDLDIWIRTTWGTNDLKDNDESSNEFDLAMQTTAYFDYLISQAVKYNRPAWSIFGLIGMMQGTLNENKFKVSNPENKLNKNDFVRCLKYLSHDFLEKFSADLIHLFSYFDERGYRLNISTDGNEVAVSIDDIIDG
ncbi:MAG: hypothetical protein IM638_19440 [Bacteroidetes bacterium]|nr:hypothetical protein [Bacteroidota bacterium]